MDVFNLLDRSVLSYNHAQITRWYVVLAQLIVVLLPMLWPPLFIILESIVGGSDIAAIGVGVGGGGGRVTSAAAAPELVEI